MNHLRTDLCKELMYYRQILELLESKNEVYPEGSLRVSQDKGRVRYYYHDGNAMTYLPKGKEDLIKALSQKEYDVGMLKLTKKRCRQIESILRDYQDDEVDQIYWQMHTGKRRFINPVVKPWEIIKSEWIQLPYEGKEIERPDIKTERGEYVRSKSEKILADCFYRKKIDYKYEKPLYLQGYGTVFPDFTFLSRRTRKEIYWEHEGMMDDPTYAQNAVKKIQSYSKNGILQGERLILTFETSKTVLSMDSVDAIIDYYLCEVY